MHKSTELTVGRWNQRRGWKRAWITFLLVLFGVVAAWLMGGCTAAPPSIIKGQEIHLADKGMSQGQSTHFKMTIKPAKDSQ